MRLSLAACAVLLASVLPAPANTTPTQLSAAVVSGPYGIAVEAPAGAVHTAPAAAVGQPTSLLNPPLSEMRNAPRGWNSWTFYRGDINEQIVKSTADAFVSSGLAEKSGWEFLVIDDGWMETQRDGDTGRLVPSREKFPLGMAALADYVHSRGMKLGVYLDAGVRTCLDKYPGSYMHERTDIETLAQWGVDFVKIDWCHTVADQSAQESYTRFAEAINATGKKIVMSICTWGVQNPWEWASGIGHMWRVSADIRKSWTSVWSNIEQNTHLGVWQSAQRGWNDVDMLLLGTDTLTYAQEETQFVLVAMQSGPLFLSAPADRLTKRQLDLLKNRFMIDFVHGDPIGTQASLRYQFAHHGDTSLVDIWAKPMSPDRNIDAFLLETENAVSDVVVTSSGVDEKKRQIETSRRLRAHALGANGRVVKRETWAVINRSGVSVVQTVGSPSSMCTSKSVFFTEIQLRTDEPVCMQRPKLTHHLPPCTHETQGQGGEGMAVELDGYQSRVFLVEYIEQ